MAQTFSNSRSKRVIIVDDDGIHEHREGNLVAFICWDELEQLESRVVRSEHGTKILTGLVRKPAREVAVVLREFGNSVIQSGSNAITTASFEDRTGLFSSGVQCFLLFRDWLFKRCFGSEVRLSP